jgi:hypothetical protein
MRFFQPTPTQYISQFSPLPLDFMAKQIQQKEAASATAEDLLSKANDLKLKAGNHTNPLVVEEYNQWLDNNKNAIAEKYYSGDINEKDVARSLSKLQSIYQNDPAIKNIKTDYAASLITNKNISEGKYQKGVSSKASLRGDQPVFDYIDPRTASDTDYADAHAYVLPTNIHSDQNFGSNYNEIREQVKNTLSTMKPDFVDINGNKFFTYGNTTVSEKQITRDMVKKMAKSLAENEIVDQTTPWVRYKSSVYKQEAGRPYNVDDLVEDITDNYFGYVESKDTRTDVNYTQASGEKSGKNKSTQGRPARRPVPMPEKEIGFKSSNFYKSGLDTKGQGVQGILEQTIMGKGNKKELNVPKQVYELPINMQNVVMDYVKNNPKWVKIAKDPNKKYSGLDELYKEIESKGILKLYEEGQIKSQSNLKVILPGHVDEFGNSDWAEIFGSNTSVKLKDLQNTVLDKQWVNKNTGKIYTVKQLMDLEEGNDDLPISGIGEYQADNSMNMFLPESTQGNYGVKPLSININGEEYITQSVFDPDPEDYSIRDIHNVIYEQNPTNLQKGTPINIKLYTDSGPVEIPIRVKYNKSNKTYELLNTDGTQATGANNTPLEYSEGAVLYNDLLDRFYEQLASQK